MHIQKHRSFNSLQTGKRIQSLGKDKALKNVNEIGFNSLQTGKRIQSLLASILLLKMEMLSFNSLQTGKRIQSWCERRVCQQPTFQFPSNGKAYPKQGPGFDSQQLHSFVSIPFKRESVSKDCETETDSDDSGCGFNSLQTGKRIQSDDKGLKVLEKMLSFNSLQTGKRIQSHRY